MSRGFLLQGLRWALTYDLIRMGLWLGVIDSTASISRDELVRRLAARL
jgi:hypothetical protein